MRFAYMVATPLETIHQTTGTFILSEILMQVNNRRILEKKSVEKSLNYCAFIIYMGKSGLTAAILAAILVHQMSLILRESVFRVCVVRGLNSFQYHFRRCQEGQVFILLSHLNLSLPIIAESSGSVGRALACGSKGCLFEHRRRRSHCVVSLGNTLSAA